MNNAYDTAFFIKRAVEIHGNLYGYKNSKYVTSQTKLLITCSKHGDFKATPVRHLNGFGCMECRSESRRLSKGDFIARSILIHGHKYNYDHVEIITVRKKVRINCTVCNTSFMQSPESHLRGTNCPQCNNIARTVTTSEFIERAIAKHGDRYDYSRVKVINLKTPVEIICSSHGSFYQAPSNHFYGQGCKLCSFELQGYSRTEFKNHCIRNNNGDGMLYVIRCEKDKEVFYKVGVTSVGLKNRFACVKHLPFNYSEQYIIEDDGSVIFDLEITLHRLLKDYKHVPSIHFEGYTECFTTIKPIEKLLKELESTEQLQLIA